MNRPSAASSPHSSCRCAPRSITARWITTRTVSASSGSTEVVTQGKTEAGVTARGETLVSQPQGSGYTLVANGVPGAYDFPPGAVLDMALMAREGWTTARHQWDVLDVRDAAGQPVDVSEGVSGATAGSFYNSSQGGTYLGKFSLSLANTTQYRTVTVRVQDDTGKVVVSRSIAIEPRSVVSATAMPAAADVVRDPSGACIAVPGMRVGGTHHASGGAVYVACEPLYDAVLGYCYDPPANGGAGQVWSAAELLAKVKTMTSERGVSTDYGLWT